MPSTAADASLDASAARLTQYMATRHVGEANGIGASALARELGLGERQLRRVISAAREQGLALCGHPSTGYYIARTPEELKAAAAFLEHRAMHSLRLLAQMRRVSLPALLGQLQLPT